MIASMEESRGSLPPRKERFRRHSKAEIKEEKRKLKLRKKDAKRKQKRQTNPAPEGNQDQRKERLQLGPFTRAGVNMGLARKRKINSKPEPLELPTRVARLDPSEAAVLAAQPDEKKCQTSKQFDCFSSILLRARREDLAPLVGEEGVANIGSGSYGKCKKMLYRGNISVVVKHFKASSKRMKCCMRQK